MKQATGIRKRKAETQDNERLSKRMSLLNLERNGQKLYVPVEQPALNEPRPVSKSTKSKTKQPQDEDTMQLDDSKHKVYIYNLDDELSDSDTSDDGRLVFLPDISKHLRETRIPPSILANKDGELAGMNNQLILYDTAVPRNHDVPEGQDLIRKAFLESRAKARAMWEERARIENPGAPPPQTVGALGADIPYTNGVVDKDIPVEDVIVENDPDAMEIE
ncbi:hypothetical protein CJF30_00005549 [Rutstroemia sp. NJR-2017a BBW]|nr:hypothetical protein CJF30_00005834 [Rutstroemia sp. NJR-2017a BBW]PQE08682.1 hypothetical protein CJF30_00005549 [Rutstroemia sp. NJR-2017a BBW]